MQRISIPDDGIRLSAVLERPGDGPCPLVIVLHGFTGTMNSRHTLAACAAMREASNFSPTRAAVSAQGPFSIWYKYREIMAHMAAPTLMSI